MEAFSEGSYIANVRRTFHEPKLTQAEIKVLFMFKKNKIKIKTFQGNHRTVKETFLEASGNRTITFWETKIDSWGVT